MGSERGEISRKDDDNVSTFRALGAPETNQRRIEQNRARATRETLEYLGGNALTAAEINTISKRAGW